MKNVLVPTDFSENSIQALKYAQVLFSSMECNFYLLYVGTLLDTKIDAESFQESDGAPTENTKKNYWTWLRNAGSIAPRQTTFFCIA